MVQAGVFLLGDKQPRWYTCCRCLHIKFALFLVILLVTALEALEAALYIFSERFVFDSYGQALYDAFEYLVLVTLIYAWIKEKAIFLAPYIAQMMIITIALAMMAFQWMFVFFFPFSRQAEQYIQDTTMDRLSRMGVFFICSLVAVLMLMISVWFLHVGCLSYVYFENQERKRKTAESARAQEAAQTVRVLVDQDQHAANKPEGSAPSTTIQTTGNFANPNFTIASDDEEDDLFRQPKSRKNPPIA
ncbi:unnamed protein product, partial [Mesorhabditis spiculigera]